MTEEFSITEYNSAERNNILDFWIRNGREMIKYRHAIYNFVLTNLRARYRRSTIGFFWSLLNPLFTMLILSVVFSTIFKNSLANFSIYIFSGLLPWTMSFNSMLNSAMSLVFAERYLKKVYIPKLIFPAVIVCVEVTNFILSLLILFFLAVFLGAKISWALFSLPFALLLTALFLLGLAMIVSMVNVYFRDLFHIIQVVFTGLFYLTPIVYPIEFISTSPFLSLIVKVNPFVYFIELFHSIIYKAEFPDSITWLICSALMFISLSIGSLVFSAKERDMVYRL